MRVTLAPDAETELIQIYNYNAEHRGLVGADSYEDFLISGIEALATSHNTGRPVEGFPDLRAITLKRRARGDGHVIVYQVDEAEQSVNVLHIFHTKMDMAARLEGET